MKRDVQFSIRALFLVMAIFAFAFGFVVLPSVRFRDRIARLKSAGVHVFPLKESLFLGWFPQFGSYDVQVEEVHDSAIFPLFSLLPNVRGITWKSPNSRDLQNLKAFPSLESIELLDVDEDVAFSLRNSKSLVSITISGRLYSGKTIRTLEGFPNLANLDLSYTSVSDSEIASIAALRNLRSLSLAGTGITDQGIMDLATLSLTSLDVSETAITDRSLSTISKIGSLKTLAIQCREVTETGICNLLQEPAKSALRSLSISSITTKNGVAAIIREFPLCKVGATIYFNHQNSLGATQPDSDPAIAGQPR